MAFSGEIPQFYVLNVLHLSDGIFTRSEGDAVRYGGFEIEVYVGGIFLGWNNRVVVGNGNGEKRRCWRGGRGWELWFQWLEEGLKGGVETHHSFVSGALEAFHYPKTSLTKEVGVVQGDLLVSHGRQLGRQWLNGV